MSIKNLNNKHLSNEQMEAVKKALAELEKQLALLDINLTPEDRNRYGRVNEQNKLFINKVRSFAQDSPSLRSFDVDWDEFMKDYQSREFLEMLISRLNSLETRACNAKILHDFDNYQDALNDYAYTAFRAGANTAGYEDKHKELKQFFAKSRKNTAQETNEHPAETSADAARPLI